MASILKKLWEGYFILFDDLTDQRTNQWPLVAKPFQGIILLGLYLTFVLKWGPKWMKHRQPYNLDNILIIYDGIQVIACSTILFVSIKYAWGWKYKWICEPVDFSNSPDAIFICKIVYAYFIIKIVDLLDTVFIVLRKKTNQISFLHIYHHTGMVLLIWGSITYLPGGHASLIGVINCGVHSVMYSYYLLSVATPSIKKYLWLKKFVTQIQIIQFFWCAAHMLIIVFKSDCEYPRWTSAVFLPQNLFMLAMFVDFYIKTYIKKPKQPNQTNNIKSKKDNDIINIVNNDFEKLNKNR